MVVGISMSYPYVVLAKPVIVASPFSTVYVYVPSVAFGRACSASYEQEADAVVHRVIAICV